MARSKKMDCRTLTLRGKVTQIDNAVAGQDNIFSYESPDREVAWRIKSAHFWPVDVRAEIGTVDGQATAQACLATDEVRFRFFPEIADPTDNRLCAWGASGFSVRAAGTDHLAYQSLNTVAEMLVAPQTVITNDLYFSIQMTTEASVSPTREWAYLVILESMSITPSESILQQLKGIGQDTSSSP